MKLSTRRRQAAERSFAKVCKHLGISLRGDAVDTPARVIRALEEMSRNARIQEPDFKFTLFDQQGDGLVVLRDIAFSALCSHHLLPFFGTVEIGYLPDKKIAGLSKFPRLVNFISRRPQTQEKFTADIADYIQRVVQPMGVVVRSKALHSCIHSRGPEKCCTTIVCCVRGKQGLTIKNEVFQHLDSKLALRPGLLFLRLPGS